MYQLTRARNAAPAWPARRSPLSGAPAGILSALAFLVTLGTAALISDRATPTQTVLLVTSTEDTDDVQWGDGRCGDTLGRCTLRGAIQEANAHEGSDAIRFRVGSGVQVFRPKTAYPVIAGETTLDGTTQPGYAGTPLIHVDGSDAGTSADGIVMAGEKGLVRGIAVTKFEGIGVVIADSEESRLQASFIGVLPDGITAAGNGGHGVNLSRARNAVVGGTTVADRNVIAGNGGNGVYIVEVSARGNRIIGNFIGTDATGDVALPNRVDGVSIENASRNEIGGQEAGATNLISGNLDDGIEIVGPGAVSNTVQANWIGTTRDGTARLPNGDAGVLVSAATDTTVLGNVVAGNFGIGIELAGGSRRNHVRGNYVGANPSLDDGLGNGGAGIALLDAGANQVGTLESPNRVVGNRGPGILVAGNRAMANEVIGNETGRVVGERARTNSGSGVVVRDGASQTVISGNAVGDGIRVWGLGTDANVVDGNKVVSTFTIGAAGSAIEIGHGARYTQVTGNQVEWRAGNGLAIIGTGTYGTNLAANVVTGSMGAGLFVGAEVDEFSAFPAIGLENQFVDGHGPGVELHGRGRRLENAVVTNNHVGIRLFGDGHSIESVIVTDNIGAGIVVHEGMGHRMRQNQIERNAGIGIDLGDDWVTLNDPLDADTGPNGLVNFPEVVWAVGAGSGAVGGARATALVNYDGMPATEVYIDLYTSSPCDPSGYGEGAGHAGMRSVITDAAGHASILVNDLVIPSGAEALTATATIIGEGTSEFSACAVIGRGRVFLPWGAR